MPKAAFDRAAAAISKVLAEFPGVRLLSSRELAGYSPEFTMGWALPSLCPDPSRELRVLLPSTVPFSPPRISVAPHPAALAWPHVEEHGLLCLLPESATVSTSAPAGVVLRLLDEACKLVAAGLAGENMQEFEHEFTSYWIRWERTKSKLVLICKPQGPSRTVMAWHSTRGFHVADDEETLRNWLSNRYGKKVLTEFECHEAPLLWLPRPLRPSEYPATVKSLRAALQEDPVTTNLLDAALLRPNPEEKLVLVGASTQHGAAVAGIQVLNVAGLNKGFSSRAPREIVLSRYSAARIIGASVERVDPDWVHGRDYNSAVGVLQTKAVVVIGLGSLGSTVAELLVKAGVGKLTLIDSERMESANCSRHLLGIPSVGINKADAIAQDLSTRFPHAAVIPLAKSLTDLLEPMDQLIRSADLIISLTGNWSAESLLHEVWRGEEALPPLLYGWTEPHAASGHAVGIKRGHGCLRCVLDDQGTPRLPVTSWSKRTMRQVPACGAMFQPYGAVDLAHIHALIAELALDLLLERVVESTHRAWIGPERLLLRAGGVWNPAWTAKFGEPVASGQLIDLPFAPGCPSCGSKP